MIDMNKYVLRDEANKMLRGLFEDIVFKCGNFYIKKGYQTTTDSFGVSFGRKPPSGQGEACSITWETARDGKNLRIFFTTLKGITYRLWGRRQHA